MDSNRRNILFGSPLHIQNISSYPLMLMPSVVSVSTNSDAVIYRTQTQWTRGWVNSGSWWWTGRPGCCSPWGRKESTWLSYWTDWTEQNSYSLPVIKGLLSSHSPHSLLLSSSVTSNSHLSDPPEILVFAFCLISSKIWFHLNLVSHPIDILYLILPLAHFPLKCILLVSHSLSTDSHLLNFLL